MHANDLRAGWQCSANIRIVKTKNDHGHSLSNLASPVAAWQERCRTRGCRAGRARKKKIQRLVICQAAPARLPRCTRPTVKRLLLRRSSLLVRWCCIKFGDSISRSVRLDDTAGRAARRHNGHHADAAERGAERPLPAQISKHLPEPPLGPRGYDEDVQHFDARSYTRPHGPGRKRVLEIHTLRARAANMQWCVIYELTISLIHIFELLWWQTNFPQLALNESVALRFDEDEYESGLISVLHTQQTPRKYFKSETKTKDVYP